jgi:hypothetical protein
MKKLTLFLILLQSAITFAQVPQKMSYQSVVRNANNQIVANQNVGVKISIVEGSLTGTTVYSETHQALTNANGLFSLETGGGTPVSGTFSGINWGNGSHFIKSEIDVTGGTNYNLSGTMELLSVPYALYAANAGNTTAGPTGATGSQGIQGVAGANGSNGANGATGANGTNGVDGKNALVNTTTEPAGTNCTNGGTKIEVGLDANSNGVLDSAEVNAAQTKYVCNGMQGISQAHLNQHFSSSFGTSLVTIATVNLVANIPVNINGIWNCGGSSSGTVYFQDGNGNAINIPIFFNVNCSGNGSSYSTAGSSNNINLFGSSNQDCYSFYNGYFMPSTNLTFIIKAIANSGGGYVNFTLTQ